MSGVVWSDPWLLLLALLVPAALLWRRRRGAPGVLFAPGGDGLPRSLRQRLLFVPRLLGVAGLLLAALALARPVLHVPLPQETEGLDILLCLDTSSSMTANDLDPARTRLDVAREAALRFVAGRPEDRIGALRFARYPDLLCPPTRDHDALAAILQAVRPVAGDGPEDATGVGTAVARAAEVLRGGVVILLTDGEENVATADKPEEIAPVHAAQLCSRLGVRVYAIRAGLDGGGSGGTRAAPDSGPVRRLAAATGGKYFEARDAGALGAVYAEIDRIEKDRFAEPRYEVVERFATLLAAAVGLLLLGRLLESSFLRVLP